MYASIIPLWHSLGIEPLLYQTRAPLTIGSLVLIPYGRDEDIGVVVANVGTDEIHLEHDVKPIRAILTNTSLLATYQLAMIHTLAAKYLIPIHRVLGFFLSQNILNRLTKKEFSQLNILEEKLPPSTPQRKIIHITDGIITGKILEAHLKPWTVLICPDDFTLYRLEQEIHTHETSILFLPSEATETRRAQAWIDITNRKYDIIVGHRKLLSYNLSQYERVIYLEDAFGREYFHYPIRIEYIDILDMFATFWHHHITIMTSVPRLTTLTRFRHFSHE